MLAHNQDHAPTGAMVAQHIVEGVERSLSEHLTLLRIRGNQIRPVCMGRLGEPTLSVANAHALHIPLRKDKKRWVSDMRPTSLWLIAAHEDRILVLASGTGVWEYRRVELAQAVEKMKDVLATQ